jgi:hypothetical protein
MNENDCITDYDWDFERMAKKNLNSKKNKTYDCSRMVKRKTPIFVYK